MVKNAFKSCPKEKQMELANVQKRNLVQHKTDLMPEGLYIDTLTGEVFATKNGLAKILNKPRTSLFRFLDSEGSPVFEVLEAEINTATGLQGGSLFDENAILELAKRFNPDLLLQCAKAGLRVYLHGLAGFKVISTATLDRESMLVKQIEMQEELIRLQRENKDAELAVAEIRIKVMAAQQNRPGLQDIIDRSSAPIQLALEGSDQPSVSIKQWMQANKKIQLEGKSFRMLVSKVHGAYKALKHKDPESAYMLQDNESGNYKKVQVYTTNDYPILEQCYLKTLIECA
jgi:hypothetical protein